MIPPGGPLPLDATRAAASPRAQATTAPPRLVVGNLDAEEDLAQLAAVRGRRLRRHPWTRAALARAAGASTLLRVFAARGDLLWTLAPVAPDLVPEVPGLPRPRLVSGALPAAPPSAVLAWCQTPAVSALRAGGAATVAAGWDGPLHELLWRLPAAAAGIAAAVNHRSFCLTLQHRLGCALPGARMIASVEDLEAHLASGAVPGGWEKGGEDEGGGGAPAGGLLAAGWDGAGSGDWVVKAALSAAGRSRVIVRRDLAPEGLGRPEVRRAVERLAARHGALLFEPWMARCGDFGAAGVVVPEGVRWIGFHRQRVDARGRFRAVEICLGAGADPMPAGGTTAGLGLPQGLEMQRWRSFMEAAAAALHAAGYRGPLGLDAWWYRDAAGRRHLHPLGEINARLTFGLAAHTLAERLRGPLGLAPGDLLRLVLGTGGPPPPAVGTVAVETVPLLHAAAPAEPGAWLEIARGARDQGWAPVEGPQLAGTLASISRR